MAKELTTQELVEIELNGIFAHNNCGKPYVAELCFICGQKFIGEIVEVKNGKQIPRYCQQCVYDYEIINQNYIKRTE